MNKIVIALVGLLVVFVVTELSCSAPDSSVGPNVCMISKYLCRCLGVKHV